MNVIDIEAYRTTTAGQRHLMAGRFEDSIHAFNEAMKNDQQSENYSAFLSRGVAHMMIKEYQKASQDFTQALDHKYDSARAWFYRGLTHKMLGRLQRAMSDFSKAIEYDVNYGAAYLERAQLHDDNNHNELARYDSEAALRISEANRKSGMDFHGMTTTASDRVAAMMHGEAKAPTLYVNDAEMAELRNQYQLS
ncbi:MAG: tetratricopeptide repeat protein [Magnetococcales bacterium]|nr:tetratricopeptide repeat protein [Magnetococcales bacterium]